MYYPEHVPRSDPCSFCRLPADLHRPRSKRVGYQADYHSDYVRKHRPKRQDRIVGIDGEGQGRNPHVYTYLAASEEDGTIRAIERLSGLRTAECLDFLSTLPDRALVVGFAFQYDLTKILADLPDRSLYDLFHEKRRAYLRNDRVQYRPVKWGEYQLNYINRMLTIRRGKKSITVWDIFRFFQARFTQSLIDWKVAEEDKLRRMMDMKEKRSSFDKLSFEDVKTYCNEECLYLTKLCRALIEAHKEAGLPLKEFYGAGSTASAFLRKIDVKSKRGSSPESMRVAIASAFFGGRFENSVVGPIQGPVYNYDISSAYPYHATFLPCLECGTWRYDDHNPDIANATLALVHWTASKSTVRRSRNGSNQRWGCLPVRASNGSIIFPIAALGGWTWKEEFLAAQRFNPNVRAVGAWLYETSCDHRPFKDIPATYLERVKLGKDAKGIVLKLGLNSIYGKLAQSQGLRPPFQSWIWAGNITSGCRAQLLDCLATIPDASDIFMFATDGVWSRARLTLPLPRDTGTSGVSKPLGGWEEKIFHRGVFSVRPGIYFPLQPTDDELTQVRARGIGRKVLYERWQRVVDAWDARQDSIVFDGIERFCGAKSSLSHGSVSGYKRNPNYGEWVSQPIKVTFNPMPKRVAINADNSLEPWQYTDWMSVPYDNAMKTEEAMLMELGEMTMEEQPDYDMVEEPNNGTW